MQIWVSVFFHDDKVRAALLLVALDFILGVSAAFKLGTFTLSYVADFLKNDILFKLVPYFALYVAALVAGGVDIVIPGLDLGVAAGAAYAAVILAWGGSILASLADLGFVSKTGLSKLGQAFFGNEKTGPPAA